MNRTRKTKWLVCFLGRRNYSWLQEKLKFILNFRKDYSFVAPRIHKLKGKQLIVFRVDGKTAHGGLSDRLRGLMAAYYYAQKVGADFRILWNSPFLLEDYFEPATFDWRVDEKSLSHNILDVAVRFQNDYSRIANDEKTFLKLMKSTKPEIHVYINTTIHEELYCQYFNELLKPTDVLSKAVNVHLEKLGGQKQYVSMSFRFIGLLGDFKDHDSDRPVLTDPREKQAYINLCLQALETIHKLHEGKRILVTTDSPIFLEETSKLPYVYVVPGTIDHIDSNSKKSEDVFLKTFLDFMLIVHAEMSYAYTTGLMFGQTKFAKTAALFGGHDYKILNDVDINMMNMN